MALKPLDLWQIFAGYALIGIPGKGNGVATKIVSHKYAPTFVFKQHYTYLDTKNDYIWWCRRAKKGDFSREVAYRELQKDLGVGKIVRGHALDEGTPLIAEIFLNDPTEFELYPYVGCYFTENYVQIITNFGTRNERLDPLINIYKLKNRDIINLVADELLD